MNFSTAHWIPRVFPLFLRDDYNPILIFFIYFIFFKDFIYLFMRHTERERQRHRQREKQAPHRKPDMGLDPGSPGSHPGLRVALNRWATGAALFVFLNRIEK